MANLDLERTPEQRAQAIMRADPEHMEQMIVEEIYDAVRDLLMRLGTTAVCPTCSRSICWVQTINGKRRVPYSLRGVPHTVDCDMAKRPGRLGRWS